MLTGGDHERLTMPDGLLYCVFTHRPTFAVPVAILHTRGFPVCVLPLVHADADGELSALKPGCHWSRSIFFMSSHLSPKSCTERSHLRALERLISRGTLGTFHSWTAWRASCILVMLLSFLPSGRGAQPRPGVLISLDPTDAIFWSTGRWSA